MTAPFLRHFDFAGKTACVTGAASGIGRATARLLADLGAVVHIADRDAEGLDTLAAGSPQAFRLFVYDQASRESVEGLARAIGPVDILVNNAGILLYEPLIDLKWDGAKYRTAELEAGAAFQLAAYAKLIGNGGQFPAVAYFILRTQRMLTTAPALFPGVDRLDGPPPGDVWNALERSYAERRAELRSGVVVAPGDPDENGDLQPAQSVLEDGRLRLTPPCRYCRFDLLCGHGLGIDLGTEAT